MECQLVLISLFPLTWLWLQCCCTVLNFWSFNFKVLIFVLNSPVCFKRFIPEGRDFCYSLHCALGSVFGKKHSVLCLRSLNIHTFCLVHFSAFHVSRLHHAANGCLCKRSCTAFVVKFFLFCWRTTNLLELLVSHHLVVV